MAIPVRGCRTSDLLIINVNCLKCAESSLFSHTSDIYKIEFKMLSSLTKQKVFMMDFPDRLQCLYYIPARVCAHGAQSQWAPMSAAVSIVHRFVYFH